MREQTVSDQVGALFTSKLRSQLDFSFANVNLAQAKLLLLDAENNENAALAALSAVLGYPTLHNFQLVEDTTPIASPPGNVDDLISQAFSMRPKYWRSISNTNLLRSFIVRNATCFSQRSKLSALWEIRQCATRFFPIGTVPWV